LNVLASKKSTPMQTIAARINGKRTGECRRLDLTRKR
jgi:hypothetical protein